MKAFYIHLCFRWGLQDSPRVYLHDSMQLLNIGIRTSGSKCNRHRRVRTIAPVPPVMPIESSFNSAALTLLYAFSVAEIANI